MTLIVLLVISIWPGPSKSSTTPPSVTFPTTISVAGIGTAPVATEKNEVIKSPEPI